MNQFLSKLAVSLLSLAMAFNTYGGNRVIIDTDTPKADIAPTMWGLFFEDINFGADGGLYAELVKNRSFEFENPMMGWHVDGYSIHSYNLNVVRSKKPEIENRNHLQIKVGGNDGCNPLVNEGFRGMPFKKGMDYRFSVKAAVKEGNVSLKVDLIDENAKVLGSQRIPLAGNVWKNYDAIIRASDETWNGRLSISFVGEGTLLLDMVSLFPSDTWKGRENGLRADLVQMLADMHPGFLRFPGGCIVEGRTLEQRYQWKKTVGPVEDRATIVNRWNTEIGSRQTPDYFQTFGLGFYEYFLLSEDIGAEPLPILNCGMACQYNTGELVPMDELEPYVQDALDLIEFANGPVSTKWGALRASMGHPEPFDLKYLGIGNEQWGPAFFERYAVFEKAIMEAHPEIEIVSSAGPSVDMVHFYYAQEELKKFQANIADEHFYRDPQWFLENAARYDSYDRNGYKVFAGEYAAYTDAQASGANKNNWYSALSEAAFMTGLERNADQVVMCSYAPLFCNVDAWQWKPDMIWFNNHDVFGTPNYYVQKLFATNRGDKVLDMTSDGQALVGQDGIYASAAIDGKTGEVIVKVVNVNPCETDFSFTLKSRKKIAGKAEMTVIASDDLDAENSFENKNNVAPVTSVVNTNGKNVNLTLKAQSMTVLRIKRG